MTKGFRMKTILVLSRLNVFYFILFKLLFLFWLVAKMEELDREKVPFQVLL
jgi:hypothetical protein